MALGRMLSDMMSNQSAVLGPIDAVCYDLSVSTNIESRDELLSRLMRSVSKTPSGCWEWTGTRSRFGHGHIGVDYGKMLTHRLSWMLHNGPIREGLVVRHKCDNPPCVNPEHLELGTPGDNTRDIFQRNRNGWTTRLRSDDLPCIKGHLGGFKRYGKDRTRQCRDCYSERVKAKWAARKARTSAQAVKAPAENVRATKWGTFEIRAKLHGKVYSGGTFRTLQEAVDRVPPFLAKLREACPGCGGQMTPRRASQGVQVFWACDKYPECK